MSQSNTDNTCHTRQELLSQPQLWRDMANERAAELSDIRHWVQQLDIREVWFTGAGTSAFIGDILATGIDSLSPLLFRSVSSTDLVSAPQLVITNQSQPLIVSFGRSGNSSETVGVLNLLDQHLPNAPRLNITCNGKSELATRISASAEQRVIILAAHDEGFAMTASFSNMLLAAGYVFDTATTDYANALLQLANRADTLTTASEQWARSCKMPSRIVFLGSGCLQFAAREATLKVMELTAGKVPGLWDSPLGFRHGPKSFIDKNTHVVLFESGNDYSRLYDQDLAAEISAQFPDSPLTVISTDPENSLHVEADLPDHLNSVLHILVAQILAVELSERLQLNVDDPFVGTNTLTRVVAGVTLHSWPGL